MLNPIGVVKCREQKFFGIIWTSYSRKRCWISFKSYRIVESYESLLGAGVDASVQLGVGLQVWEAPSKDGLRWIGIAAGSGPGFGGRLEFQIQNMVFGN